ncbi:cleft lip and palate transmembrane protein 1 [Cystoisospora suis]|uniref:Cleft lip and palate transmembrane protein 1 n=1 Tax=Cystoisospora suis TaxID=483139 RepID=A0A2C6L388_9APIC|nr:cleft lip and palate transmembrane protein 1 [Cystoisospora suis]
MGKIGAAVLVVVISYFSFSVYSIYRETQPPVYTPGMKEKGGGGGEEDEEAGPPPISTNLLPSSLEISFHFFVSPVASLPPLKTLLVAKNTRLYMYAGSVSRRPYNSEGEMRLEREAKKFLTPLERLQDSLNFSGKGKPDVEVRMPSLLRRNATLYFHVRSLDEDTGEELPLQSVHRLSAPVVPGETRRKER